VATPRAREYGVVLKSNSIILWVQHMKWQCTFQMRNDGFQIEVCSLCCLHERTRKLLCMCACVDITGGL